MFKRFRPDRSFDHFNLGEVVELDTEDEVTQRYLRTGYLEEIVDLPARDVPAESDVQSPALADAPTSTTSAAPAETLGEDGGSDAGTESTTGATEGAPRDGVVKSSRRRRQPGGTVGGGDDAAGAQPDAGDGA